MTLEEQNGHNVLAAIEVEEEEPSSPDVSELLAIISDREKVALRQARAWQLIGTLAMVAVVLLSAALIWQRSQYTVEPYQIGVTEDGRVMVLGTPPHAWTLEEVWIKKELERYLTNARTFPVDKFQVTKSRTAAWNMSLPLAQKQLTSFFRALPIEKVGQIAVSVQKIERLDPPTKGRTWEVAWIEEAVNMRSGGEEIHAYTGFMTIAVKKPEIQIKNGYIVTPVEELEHLGIWVESFTYDERPSSQKGAK